MYVSMSVYMPMKVPNVCSRVVACTYINTQTHTNTHTHTHIHTYIHTYIMHTNVPYTLIERTRREKKNTTTDEDQYARHTYIPGSLTTTTPAIRDVSARIHGAVFSQNAKAWKQDDPANNDPKDSVLATRCEMDSDLMEGDLGGGNLSWLEEEGDLVGCLLSMVRIPSHGPVACFGSSCCCLGWLGRADP
jgi:hypothetical protein